MLNDNLSELNSLLKLHAFVSLLL